MRTAVLTAAKSVFSARGYRNTRVADILEEAGIARATFYKYFTNKRQVFFELITGLFKTLYNEATIYLLQDPYKPDALAWSMKKSLANSYRLILDNRALLNTYYSEAVESDIVFRAVLDDFENRMSALLHRMLDKGVEAGVFRDNDADLVSRSLFALLVEVPARELMAGGRKDIDIDAMATELVGIVMVGLSVE